MNDRSNVQANLVSTANINRKTYQIDGAEMHCHVSHDCVALEVPLYISLVWQSENKPQRKIFTMTMRTPGDEQALAIGLLVAEGVIRTTGDVVNIVLGDGVENGSSNEIDIYLRQGLLPNWQGLQRAHTSYSSCGLCGKSSLQALELNEPPKIDMTSHWLSLTALLSFAGTIAKYQPVFTATGGVHAVGSFDSCGKLIHLKEDIGRHNAMDKVIGASWLASNELERRQPRIIFLSGRVSFELVQKAVMSAVPVIVAVGAPSSLAIKVAQRFNVTLIAFMSAKRFNVYHGEFRLKQNS